MQSNEAQRAAFCSTAFATFERESKSAHCALSNQAVPELRGTRRIRSRDGDAEEGAGHALYCDSSSLGQERLRMLLRLLDKLAHGRQYTRTGVQREIHKGMVAAVAPCLFKHQTGNEMRLALEAHGIEQQKQQFMVLAGRRVGKTVATALFVAAYLLSVPESRVCVFSTGKRASNLFMQEVKSMLCCTTDTASLICMDNNEMLEICVNGERRRISSFPGNARTLRGVGGDLLVLEEAAYIKQDVFYEVIVPLMGLRNTAVLAISTPGTSDNWYSSLLSKRNSRGDLIFSCYTAHVKCVQCRLNGVTEGCTHMSGDTTPWKSKAKREVTEAMYADNRTMALRELSGEVADDVSSAYAKHSVESLFCRPRFHITGAPSVIFVAIDPCGGGPSYFAIASVFLVERDAISSSGTSVDFVFCGAENTKIRDHADVARVVTGHIHSLRCIYPADSTKICVGIESNLGMEASTISHILRAAPGVTCLTETRSSDGTMSAGFTTTHRRKIRYYELLQAALAQDALWFASKFASCDENATLAALKQQMLSYKRIVSKPTNAFMFEKQTFSGKVDGAGRMAPERLCDDLLLAAQMALFVSMLVLENKAESCPAARYAPIAIKCPGQRQSLTTQEPALCR